MTSYTSLVTWITRTCSSYLRACSSSDLSGPTVPKHFFSQFLQVVFPHEVRHAHWPQWQNSFWKCWNFIGQTGDINMEVRHQQWVKSRAKVQLWKRACMIFGICTRKQSVERSRVPSEELKSTHHHDNAATRCRASSDKFALTRIPQTAGSTALLAVFKCWRRVGSDGYGSDRLRQSWSQSPHELSTLLKGPISSWKEISCKHRRA